MGVGPGPQRWGNDGKPPPVLCGIVHSFFFSTICNSMEFPCLFEYYLTGRLQSLECAGIIPGLKTGKKGPDWGQPSVFFGVITKPKWLVNLFSLSIILELDCGIKKKVAWISIILA